MNQINMFEEMYDSLPIKKDIKLGTFFSGIGSPEKALNNIGVNVKLQFFSEINKYAIQSYMAIHDVSIDKSVGSISDLKGVDLPYCDMWFGGFPCQDISLAGKGKGFSIESESRSSLGWEMIRLLREVETKPTYIVFENVAAIFNNTHRPILNLFKRDLEELGYTLFNKLLNSKHYGIPQNRNRYFLVAILGKYSYTFPKKQKLKLRLKDMLEDVVDSKFYLSDKMINYIFTKDQNNKKNGSGTYQVSENSLKIDRDIAVPITTREGNTRADSSSYVSVVGNSNPSGKGMNGNIYDVDKLSPTLTTNKGEGIKIIQLNDPIHSNNRVYSKDGLAPTIKTMQTGGNQQPFIAIPEDTKKGYAEACEGDGIYLDRPHQKRGVVQKGMIQTLKTSGDDLGVIVHEIKQKVSVRKHIVDLQKLKSLLKKHKKFTNKELAMKLNLPITKIEHWFRNDKSFSIPDCDSWHKLKELLNIENSDLDKQICEYIEKENDYDMSNRVYDSKGCSPTITSAENLKVTTVDTNLKIRKLTPKECYRLMGFTDQDYNKAASVVSNSQLYKQAGNSIVVNVLEAIFTNLLLGGNQ